MIAGRQEREERRRLGGDAARERHRAAAVFEVGHPLLEHRHGRIHDARVGVAVLLQVEIRGRGLRILEHVAGGLKDRHRARAGVRIGALAGMNLPGVEPEAAGLFHEASLPVTGRRLVRLPREELAHDRDLARFLEQEAVVSVGRLDDVELDLLPRGVERRGDLFAIRPADRASRS